MKRMRIARMVYAVLVLGAYAMMTTGYLVRGEVWYDAMYFAFQAFLINYKDGAEGNVILYVGRVVCPLLTATGLFVVLRSGLKLIADAWVSHFSDATAVYYDTEQMKELARGFKRPVLMENRINKKALYHVILFSKDVDSLTFYEKMRGEIKPGSKVFICLDRVESKLLKMSNVYFSNKNEIIARYYWRTRNLQKYLKNGRVDLKIAILGFDTLGQNLLDYGLMNNIYSLDQSIQYHVWSLNQGGQNQTWDETVLYKNVLGEFDMMNGDSVTFHPGDWREDLMQLKSFDRIIVAKEPNVEVLQALLYLSCEAEIDFFNPEGTDLPEFYMGDKLTGFGELKNILTEECIKTDKLYRDAKELNFNYWVKKGEKDENGKVYAWDRPDVEELMEAEWQTLDGFTKGSNVACADYHRIRLLVMEAMGLKVETLTDADMTMLAEIEHLRWSRYHYVNHWRMGKKEDMPFGNDGVQLGKDKRRRLHTCLVPFAELSEPVVDQDKNSIREMFIER